EDALLHVHGGDARHQVVLDLVLVAGVGVHHEPLPGAVVGALDDDVHCCVGRALGFGLGLGGQEGVLVEDGFIVEHRLLAEGHFVVGGRLLEGHLVGRVLGEGGGRVEACEIGGGVGGGEIVVSHSHHLKRNRV